LTDIEALIPELESSINQMQRTFTAFRQQTEREVAHLSSAVKQLDCREARNYRRTDHRVSKVEEELQRTDGRLTTVEEELSELRSAVADLSLGKTQKAADENAADDMAAAYLVEEDDDASDMEDTMEDMPINSTESTAGKGVDDSAAINSTESTDGKGVDDTAAVDSTESTDGKGMDDTAGKGVDDTAAINSTESAAGKGADDTAIESAAGKGADDTAIESTDGKGAEDTAVESTDGKGADEANGSVKCRIRTYPKLNLSIRAARDGWLLHSNKIAELAFRSLTCRKSVACGSWEIYWPSRVLETHRQ
jgi:chromosome segregation ATPase